jgi:hypothetical protein
MTISIEVHPDDLTNYGAAHLAAVWHAVQISPVPHGDRATGDLVEVIGREIIRRWLKATTPELWHHQGRDYFWQELCKVGSWSDGVFTPHVHHDDDPAGDAAQERA